ncbi:hypothetical protein Tco_0179078, partial [Tanacetum coccineum]
VMDVSQSPEGVFDFPVTKPEPEPTPKQAQVEAPVNMNGWIEWDVSLLGEINVPIENLNGNPDEDVDMLMDDDDEDDDDDDNGNEDGWEVDDKWLMAPVTPPLIPVVPPPSTFKVGKPSTAAPEHPFLVGRPLPEVVRSVAVHHEENGGLSV